MNKILLGLSVLALCACTYNSPVNNEGFYTEMDLSTVNWSAVNRSGSACQTNLFGLIPFGDNSVPTAVKNARIEKLLYADTDYTLYFPILSRECTNVWGSGTGMTTIPTSATATNTMYTAEPKKNTKTYGK